MAVDNIGFFNSTLRLTGLSGSGIDTESIVKQLMMAERIPLDRLYQKKQLAEWKRDAYREITNKLRELKDAYFNVAKPASNLMSTSSLLKYKGTSSNSDYVTVSGNAESIAGSHTVSVISLATAQTVASSGRVTGELKGNEISDLNLEGKKIRINLDGVIKEIELGNYSEEGADIGAGIQELVDKAFGEGKIIVSFDEVTRQLSFDTNANKGSTRITLMDGSSDSGLEALGFISGASNRLNTGMSLESLSSSFANELTFNSEGKLEFTINSKKFSFDKSVSLSYMMSTINSDKDANVIIKYDEVTDKFTIASKQTGTGDNIVISEEQGGNFFGIGGAACIDTDVSSMSSMTPGTDATAIIDGQIVVRSTNSFTINGVTYTLKKEHEDPSKESETVTLSIDTDEVYNNIKGFVDKYNEVISFINTKLSEKYNRDYQPLTEAQKKEMKEEDIKKWEEVAKTGLLKNDPILQDIVYSMRRALSDSIEGLTVNLSSIGITTGDYSEKGKLIIDEEKLREAIQNSPYKVAELFTKKSEISYSEATTTELRQKRYSVEGLASRISDILDDNIRTIGGKGKLLERAGIPGDATEFDNMLYDQIKDYNEDIDALIKKLADKEERYFAKFTAMEKYISQMNAQSNWLFMQFNSSS